jgi:hypothetical protein
MSRQLRTWVSMLKAFLRRNTGWIGEFATSTVVLFWTIAGWLGVPDSPMLLSMQVLTRVAPAEWLYAAALWVALSQLGSLMTAPLWPATTRWVRWACAGGMFMLWGALAWALVIDRGFHQSVPVYLGYAGLSAYAILSLLQDDA